MNVNIIGYIGCFFLFISFVPQTYKLISQDKIESSSLSFLFTIICSSIFLGIYAYSIQAYPVFIANTSVFMNNFFILILYLYKKNYCLYADKEESYDGVLV